MKTLLSLLVSTVAMGLLGGCGKNLCVAGFGSCSDYGKHDNPVDGVVALKLDPISIYFDRQTSLTVGGGTPPYTLYACTQPTDCSSTARGTFSPTYYLTNTLTASYQPMQGPPPGVTPIADSNGQLYYNMQIQVTDSQSHTTLKRLSVYLQH